MLSLSLGARYDFKKEIETGACFLMVPMKTELIKIFVSSLQYLSGAPNDGFLLNSLKTLFSLSRVLLDIQKCILSGTINLYPFGHPRGNSSLFEISRKSIIFSRICFKHFKHFITKMRIFSDSSFHYFLVDSCVQKEV